MKQSTKAEVKRVVLTGGHAATTALAVVEEIARRKSGWQIHFIGTKLAIEGRSIPTLESVIYPKMGVDFHGLFTGRLQRHLTLWTVPSLLKIPSGFLHAFLLLLKLKPDVVLSFGGFAGFPVVLAARLLNIPVVVHEQTAVTGRANRLSSYFAKRIALSRRGSLRFFPSEKTIIVGNPILSKIAKVKAKSKLGEPPTIYVTGGSRGSQFINSQVEEIIKEVLKSYKVIHHTGFLDFRKFVKLKQSLAKHLSIRYEVHKVIDPGKIDEIYSQADIVLARAGANTVSEIIATKRPAILIPLPFSYKDEQTENALFAQKFGIAKKVPQRSLTAKVLLRSINEIRKNWDNMVSQTRKRKSPDLHAAKKLVDLLEEYL